MRAAKGTNGAWLRTVIGESGKNCSGTVRTDAANLPRRRQSSLNANTFDELLPPVVRADTSTLHVPLAFAAGTRTSLKMIFSDCSELARFEFTSLDCGT